MDCPLSRATTDGVWHGPGDLLMQRHPAQRRFGTWRAMHTDGSVHMTTPQPFLDALVSPRRAPELAETDDIFGFLIGSWDLEAVLHDADGQTQTRRGELHVARVLEGRAIQDLFIFPRRADRASGVPAQGDRYATTIRTYDRTRRAWRVEFINPADDATSARLLARRNGHGIMM